MLNPCCEHLPLYLSGCGRASQETAISGSCLQQALLGICNSVWLWWLNMGWISRWSSLWMAFPSVSGWPFLQSLLHCLSLYLLPWYFIPFLRRTEASTLHPSFFLSFIWSMNCIFGILSFWGNIHLSMSAYYVCSFVTGLPHTGYFLVPSICRRTLWSHCF